MTEPASTTASLEAMISGTLNINDARHHNDSEHAVNEPAPPGSPVESHTREDEQALEWHEVIELQAFSERKAWIEEKIKFLERLPPIEVFVGLDAVRSSAEEVPDLPTRAELDAWLAEHDRIEKETEIFDSGELKKLKKFTKAATQRNLSPEDTDLIELTLTTIYELDKLLHLLRDRSDNLDLLGIRLTWEERRCAAWAELRSVLADIRQFLTTRARWAPAIYDGVPAVDEEQISEPGLKRRNSVVSIASMASDSSALSTPGFSRSSRFKLAEQLSRDAAQFASRVSSLRHSKISSAGKILDKLIDHSRRPVPDELLDEQDKLENKGINELEDIGKFIMSVVMQWKKADEIYVETMKDKADTQTLAEEIELARYSHPSSRQDVAFMSRANALSKRLLMRDNPGSATSAFPRPQHPLFSDQSTSNDAIARLLAFEIATAIDYMRKADSGAKEYHATFEAVRRVEKCCKTASKLSTQLDSIIQQLEIGVVTEGDDGTPPDLSSDACLDNARHVIFLTALPSVLQELEKVDAETVALLPTAQAALLHLDRPGVDSQFKIDCTRVIERLAESQSTAKRVREATVARASTLTTIRQVWTAMSRLFSELESIRDEVADATERQMWRQQIRPYEAPPTPESPSITLPPLTVSLIMVDAKLNDIQARLHQTIFLPISSTSPSLGDRLKVVLGECADGLSTYTAQTRQLAQLWDAVQSQAATMGSIRDEVYGLQVQTEELKIRFDKGVQDVLSGTLSGDELLLTEGALSGDLKRLQDSTRNFSQDIAHRISFVGQAHLPQARGTTSGRKRSLSSSFSVEILREAIAFDAPVDPMLLDQVVRADCNSYCMMLAGAVKSLEQKADHFQLAKTAKAVDNAVASLLDNICRVVTAVAFVQGSLNDTNSRHTLDDLDKFSNDVQHLLQANDTEIARSLSPIRGLIHRLRSIASGSESVPDGIIPPRLRAFDQAESQYHVWKEGVIALQQHISHSQQAEHARLAKEARLMEEKEHLAAEARARVAREQAEEDLRAKAEEERLERERLEAKERAELETREKEDRDRAEADAQATAEREAREKEERQRLEADARAAAERERVEEERQRTELEERKRAKRKAEEKLEAEWLRTGSGDLSAVYEETELDISVASSSRVTQVEDDMFGFRLAPSSIRHPMNQQGSDIQVRILELRKRLRSIHINEVARPTPRSDLPLPSDDVRKRMEADLSAVISEADSLPSSFPDKPLIEVEIRSLRSELQASIELMQNVHNLADFSVSLRQCDDALSDLLEHVDSYPSPPLSALAAPHVSDASLTPEEQLSARLTFTRNVIGTMASRYYIVADDPRTTPERERITQTWSELEAMGMDRVNGAKSRPGSVMSSGRSSRASVSSSQASAKRKKAAGYSKLSVGSADGRFLAPPALNARRSASGSSVGHTRTPSKASIASSGRSVSGPMSSSTTLHGSTFSSRQRTSSVSSTTSVKSPLRQPHLTPSRPRAQTGHALHTPLHTPRTASPALSDASSISISRSNLSQSSTNRSSWARAPRQSFPTITKSPPRTRPGPSVRKPYIANPKNKLDVAVGDVVNKLPVNINVEHVADTWKDQSGKYWIGDQDPKLCFCRILRSQTVMVRVGGGWSELSKFIKDHFADSFRILPDSPRLGSREEKWISSATLSQAAESLSLNPPRTPEPKSPYIPSFALSTPNGTSPKSIKTASSPGSPLTPLQFLRRVDRESPRPETPSRVSRPGITAMLSTPARQPIWRP
ncbi:uncharacterized protein FIBRA_01184 [Fibroporia radiculosa]|uniref:GAR domain-containing protein n=1 Tax=Fibroporia radiculosa TaxID=599839 RepID=J4H0Y7_9APHY|nr:uncharacterized protein FIBRA_01184 [Fibroporia radiculosa]CCL99169.1 predicted protein [Fibroporia radiculosa]